jgi:hypothetical protein
VTLLPISLTAAARSRRPVMKTYASLFTNRFAVARPNAAIAPGNERDFPFKPGHGLLLRLEDVSC